MEEGRGKLSEEQIDNFTDLLNKTVNSRWLPEWFEGWILRGVVISVDWLLRRKLGDKAYDLMFDINAGLDAGDDVSGMIGKLATEANTAIGLPFWNEEEEYNIFYTLISMFASALQKGKDINNPDVPVTG
jgi:hypothetical protein